MLVYLFSDSLHLGLRLLCTSPVYEFIKSAVELMFIHDVTVAIYDVIENYGIPIRRKSN